VPITFEKGNIPLGAQQTYYVYAWVKYSGKIYPDAYVMSFTAGNNGEIIVDATEPPAPTTEYNITFNGNGGTASSANATTVGGKLASLPDATYDGHTFLGWFDAAEGGNEVTTNTVFTSDDTVYAHWLTNVPNNPAPNPAPAGKDNWVKYNGGNSFSSNKSAVPTSVEIDGQEVSFVGNGKSFTVGCVPAGAQRITVRWNSTSITTNFKPDAAAYCSEVEIPKTGDLSVLGYAVMAIVATAGAMGLKK